MSPEHIALAFGVVAYVALCLFFAWRERSHGPLCVCGRCGWKRARAAMQRATANDKVKVQL